MIQTLVIQSRPWGVFKRKPLLQAFEGSCVHFQYFRRRSLQELANSSPSQQMHLSFQETYQHNFFALKEI